MCANCNSDILIKLSQWSTYPFRRIGDNLRHRLPRALDYSNNYQQSPSIFSLLKSRMHNTCRYVSIPISDYNYRCVLNVQHSNNTGYNSFKYYTLLRFLTVFNVNYWACVSCLHIHRKTVFQTYYFLSIRVSLI